MDKISTFISTYFDWFYITVPGTVDIIEILILSFFIYRIMLWFKQSRAWTLLKGIVMIVLFTAIAAVFQFNTILYLLKNAFSVGIIAVVILFQPELRRMLVKNLTAAGYTVDGVPDGAEALAYLDAAAYDAAVLDIMMPKVDGLTVLRTLRARCSALPVLLLTARDAVADRVDGLDAGADDYLIKPFAMDELLARLRVLTRKKGSGSTNVYTLADLTVDTAARTAKRGGRTLELSAREYALLEYLIRSKGVVLSRQQIEDNLWSLDYAGGTNVVDVYISYLRKKLELPGEQKLLHTVRGMGWVLKEDA